MYTRSAHARPYRSAVGCGMGDVAAPVTFADLAAQVNRFGSAAPAELQFAPTPFVASGNLDPALALAAVTIYQRRATAAYDQFHDQGSATAIARANAGFADPGAWVTQNLAEVIQTVGAYADSLGLPAAGGFGVTSNLLLAALGIGLALWLWK